MMIREEENEEEGGVAIDVVDNKQQKVDTIKVSYKYNINPISG